MKKLIVIRHGEYDEATGHLSEKGRVDVQRLVEKLSPVIGDSTVRIFTSPATRAVETAEIFADMRGGLVEQHPILCPEKGKDPDYAQLLTWMETRQAFAEVIILVTHGVVGEFAGHYANRRLGLKVREEMVDHDMAYVVDCEHPDLDCVLL